MYKGAIDINSPEYPSLLKEISDPPRTLYYKGNLDSAIFGKCLTVVGTRCMTRYGKQITDILVSEIAANGITIVSSFMYGIDAAAHKAAVDEGGKTIAVMPCGIDRIYPEDQEVLYNEILDSGGLVISELQADSPPALWTFARRNRIMAGISQGTVVIEAGEKSGSLSTAELARRYKREVFSVPGPLTSSVSKGTMKLIKEGAHLVTEASDVLYYYGIKAVSSLGDEKRVHSQLNELEQSIIEHLMREPMEINLISRFTKVSIPELSTALSVMQLKGVLAEEGGKYYVG